MNRIALAVVAALVVSGEALAQGAPAAVPPAATPPGPAYGTNIGSVEVAVAKARSAAMFRRPTKVFQDQVAQGGIGLRLLGLPGAVPLDGGVPLLVGGKIIGAVGLSGGTSDQDGACALAGAAAVK
jgi:uncharacterized protein GlcG (DUF336 family)